MASAARRDLRAHFMSAAALARTREPGKVHQATGEVLAFSSDSLLLLHARGRGKQKMAFTLTAQTKETVSLNKGERILVFYREIGGRRIVARIRSPRPYRRARRSLKAKSKS